MKITSLGLAALTAACTASQGAYAQGAQTVPRCQLGRSNVSVSCVMLGTLHLHEAGTPQGALDIINAAVSIGITTIDTSDVYNSMPGLLGQALALQPGLRERVEIVGKMDIIPSWGGFGFDTGSAYDASTEHLTSVMAQYLTSLNTKYIDVLMLHHQDYL